MNRLRTVKHGSLLSYSNTNQINPNFNQNKKTRSRRVSKATFDTVGNFLGRVLKVREKSEKLVSQRAIDKLLTRIRDVKRIKQKKLGISDDR